MTKQIVDEDGYIHVCNEELQRHSQYENGMEIVGAPEGESGSDLAGYDWKGPNALMPGIVSQVVAIVDKTYQLRVTK